MTIKLTKSCLITEWSSIKHPRVKFSMSAIVYFSPLYALQLSKNLADVLYRSGHYDEALEAYERAAKLDPELGDDLYFKMGNIAYKRREHDRARTSWQRATTLNPGHQLARANLDMLEAAP